MFPELAYNATKRITQIQTDLQNREKLKQQSKPTGMLDAEINTSLKYLDNELDQLDQEVKGYTLNNGTNLLAKEIQKRKNLYNELSQKRMEIKKRIEQNHLNQLQHSLLQNRQQSKKNYESFGSVNALKMHGIITEKQDDYLQKINDKVLSIKSSSESMGRQIKEQNGLIDQLDEDTDFSLESMNRLRLKMNYYLEQSSSWKLLLIMALEIFIFIIVIAI